MEVRVSKLTDEVFLRAVCSFMIGKESKISLSRIYNCEHSPIRTQIFWVELVKIPTFASVHFVRHKIGVEHFVSSNRDDYTGVENEKITRETPVNHGMLINAQALIGMARKRLCYKSHKKTREIMLILKEEIRKVDGSLPSYLVPDCIYRGRCHELKPCARKPFLLM
jgi:hypothetical protein